MKKTKLLALVLLIALSTVALSAPLLVSTTKAAGSGWTLINDSRPVKGYSDLRETIWQKNPIMQPNGQYDKIGLHRLIKTGITPKGVVFVNPGTFSSGDLLISNPETSDENSSQPIYWANRGFDVYVVDYRTHFVPRNINDTNQLAFMADWGWDQWISDIKEAVDKAKETSQTNKVFMVGQSFGGSATMCYAAKYQQDLRGIILLDGGTPSKKSNDTNKFNLPAAINLMKASGKWAMEMPNLSSGSISNVPPGTIYIYQFMTEFPGAPANIPGTNTPLSPPLNPITNKPWANITEWATINTSPSLSNIRAGYNNVTKLVYQLSGWDRYWPNRLSLEVSAIIDWTNCPYLSYDFDDYFKTINVPLLSFSSELYGYPMRGNLTNGLATSDFTTIVLPKYGHADVFFGTYTVRDVNQPALEWMTSHYQSPAATAFSSATILAGQTWYFFVHSNGGANPHKYQWYEGTNPVAGATNMVLAATKSTAGTYTYYCKVTDAEGTTTNSNNVTLTVK